MVDFQVASASSGPMCQRLLIFVLVVYGGVLPITTLRAGAFLRTGAYRLYEPLGHMLSCPACTGFWVGLFASFTPVRVLGPPWDAFLGLSGCWILHAVTTKAPL